MIAEIKEAAQQVRKYWAQFPPERWVRNGISEPGEKLLALIDALPSDSVMVPRETLKRWAEAADAATCGSAIKGDGYMHDDERRALYAVDTEIEALLK